MTKDMESVVSRELRDRIPPTMITVEGITRAGKRRILGRRLGFAGAFVTGMAALTAGILVLQPGPGGPGANAGASADPSVSSSAVDDLQPPTGEQPSFPLPDLDWSRQYDWGTDGSHAETPETAMLTDALWEWTSGRDDVHLWWVNGITDGRDPVTRENLLPVYRTKQDLYEDDDPSVSGSATGAATGYSRPVYILNTGSDFERSLIWTVDGVENSAAIDMTVYPKGSYLPGAESVEGAAPSAHETRHLVAGCEDYRYDAQGTGENLAEFTCDESEGPDGERIITVEAMFNATTASEQKMITAVVYQPNGNAVVIEGTAYNSENERFTRGMGPGLTADDMADLALSLPDVIVR